MAADLENIFKRLEESNNAFSEVYPIGASVRQPVHTVYGGAHLFKADTVKKLSAIALQTFLDYAKDGETLAAVLETSAASRRTEFWNVLFDRVVQKLKSEAVEDFRIDFEDGYGYRTDEEEDQHARFSAQELSRAANEGNLPPFVGIRVKPLNEQLKRRSVRTLDLFMDTLLESTKGALPRNFVVTLPKITTPQQIAALEELLGILERKHKLGSGCLKMEIMIEQPQALINNEGRCMLPAFVQAAAGRCRGAHFGAYDYTSCLDITSAAQTLDHPACDFARSMMKIGLAETGVWLSDGATNVLPIAPHKGSGLTPDRRVENELVIRGAWKLSFKHVTHSLKNGFYQGWDLHPAQLPMRYAACYAFFLHALPEAQERLRGFMDKAAQASLLGDKFDDAATGQGLLNFFLKALSCGAITEAEAEASGLSISELRTRSFTTILNGRRNK